MVGLADTAVKLVAYWVFDVTWLKLTTRSYPPAIVWLENPQELEPEAFIEQVRERLKLEGRNTVVIDREFLGAIEPENRSQAALHLAEQLGRSAVTVFVNVGEPAPDVKSSRFIRVALGDTTRGENHLDPRQTKVSSERLLALLPT